MTRIDDRIAAVAEAHRALRDTDYKAPEWETRKAEYHALRGGIRRRYNPIGNSRDFEYRGYGIHWVHGSLYTGLHSRIAIGRTSDTWQVHHLREDGTCGKQVAFGSYRSRTEAAREIDSMINGGSRYDY